MTVVKDCECGEIVVMKVRVIKVRLVMRVLSLVMRNDEYVLGLVMRVVSGDECGESADEK